MTNKDEPWNGRIRDTESDAHPDRTAADIFELLWDSMSDILGTPATATLIRRAIRRTVVNEPELKDVTIEQTEFGYQYFFTNSWLDNSSEYAFGGLELMIQELRLLLIELTGPVVVRRLEHIPPLRRLGMTSGEST